MAKGLNDCVNDPLITFSKQKIEPDSIELSVYFLVHTVPQEENAGRNVQEQKMAKRNWKSKKERFIFSTLDTTLASCVSRLLRSHLCLPCFLTDLLNKMLKRSEPSKGKEILKFVSKLVKRLQL